MKNRHLIVIASLVAASTGAFAAEMTTSTTREQRMDEAYQNYRNGGMQTTSTSGASMQGSRSSGHMNHANANPGPAERAENAVKRGYHKTKDAVKGGAEVVGDGAERAGHSVANGARKARDSVTRTGERMGGSEEAAAKAQGPAK